MSEQYRKNVQAMCDRLGISNPIHDIDVRIRSVVIERSGLPRTQQIKSTDMNRAGMVFLQEQFSKAELVVCEALLRNSFQKKAEAHFAELWLDAREKNRTLIMALKGAWRIKIDWLPGELAR